jgi:hypothetical protein
VAVGVGVEMGGRDYLHYTYGQEVRRWEWGCKG